MTMIYWVLWFVITVQNGELMHFPIDTHYETKEACENEIDKWDALIREQFKDDQNLRVYCEESSEETVTKGI